MRYILLFSLAACAPELSDAPTTPADAGRVLSPASTALTGESDPDGTLTSGESTASDLDLVTVKGCVNGVGARAALNVCLMESCTDGLYVSGASGPQGVMPICVSWDVELECRRNGWHEISRTCAGAFCDGFQITMPDPACPSCGWKIQDLTMITTDGFSVAAWTADEIAALGWEPLPVQ
jgi:hypothetical protein